MRSRYSHAQEMGLVVLVAMGILASGVAMYVPRLIHHHPPAPIPAILPNVRVIVPTFLDSPPKVDINTAGVDELATLPGIGDVLAQRIIAYRQEHGSFHTIGELANVSGVGDTVIAKVSALVTLGQ